MKDFFVTVKSVLLVLTRLLFHRCSGLPKRGSRNIAQPGKECQGLPETLINPREARIGNDGGIWRPSVQSQTRSTPGQDSGRNSCRDKPPLAKT